MGTGGGSSLGRETGRLAVGVDERVMKLGVDEGTPGRERRDGRGAGERE